MRRKPTDAEAKLWKLLRHRQLEHAKFRRQVPVGPYIADFVCQEFKLIVEADGGQHAESSADASRDRWFANAGYQVARYWNNEILQNPEGVLGDIVIRLKSKLVPPQPGRA